ncbi:MAG: U32 family peptidase [Alistipes sp.]|nr:U32 family peptidase [Alistipes sp.]
MRYIELLSPAKDLTAAIAAIDHGADAVYMGGVRFGARQAAGNSIDDIARAAEYAHRYGARLHATLNTLLFESELRDAELLAHELIAAGVDALIVQDMAFREMNLPIEMHASTQVGNTTPEGVKFLEECGFARVILERSLTLEQIREICKATNAEVECFVHGAICVGHSGRCFLSRTTSHRSGNRGECSQPCRLPYDLKDEQGRTILSGKHLLSVRDMDLSGELELLMDAGITSFKIEGRLKDARYIKNVVSHYRHRIDDILARRKDIIRPSAGKSTIEFTPDPAKSFTRGASTYMLHGKQAGVASFDTPKAIGEYLGQVERITRDGFALDKRSDLAAGDGICILTSEGMKGTNINSIEGTIIIPNRIEGIAKGAKVYRNYDHRFTLSLDRSRTRRAVDVKAWLTLSAEGCTLKVKDEQGVEAEVTRKESLQPANDPQKMCDTARRQIEKSGGTIFSVTEVEVKGGEFFAPASLLSDMRREALESLLKARIAAPRHHKILTDDGSARYPWQIVTKYENVTNSLADKFYRRHGVEQIEPALELQPTTRERVMISSYCIRREIGECLKEGSKLRGNLYIEHGAAHYRLNFDCKQCLMTLTDCSSPQMKK